MQPELSRTTSAEEDEREAPLPARQSPCRPRRLRGGWVARPVAARGGTLGGWGRSAPGRRGRETAEEDVHALREDLFEVPGTPIGEDPVRAVLYPELHQRRE